jgi:hypothetical protein
VFEDKALADEAVKAVEKQVNQNHDDGEVDGIEGKVEARTIERTI